MLEKRGEVKSRVALKTSVTRWSHWGIHHYACMYACAC